jgi:hypothetical protein
MYWGDLDSSMIPHWMDLSDPPESREKMPEKSNDRKID